MSKKNYKEFVQAAKAKGIKYYQLGGGVDLSQGATQIGGPPGGITTQGGLAGLILPQSQFQANLAPTTQLNYTPLINQAANQAFQGQGQFNQNLGQEQALSAQLAAQGVGQGPNPAQAQLAQNTQANIANQAALMAGQRGAAANPALIARQAAQQGAVAQQQSVGQAATLQAQQELASQQAAGQMLQGIGGQITSQQGANTNLFGTGASALNAQNQNLVNNYNQAQGTNAATASQNAKGGQGLLGGLLGGIGTVLGFLNDGGEVEKPEGQDLVGLEALQGVLAGQSPQTQNSSDQSKSSPLSLAGKFLTGFNQGMQGTGNGSNPFAFSKGGKVPAMVSPGEISLSPSKAKKVAEGKESPMSGKKIPGQAKVKGDSLKNDIVPMLLEEGGIIIPRSKSSDPGQAAAFVRSIMAKKRGKK